MIVPVTFPFLLLFFLIIFSSNYQDNMALTLISKVHLLRENKTHLERQIQNSTRERKKIRYFI